MFPNTEVVAMFYLNESETKTQELQVEEQLEAERSDLEEV